MAKSSSFGRYSSPYTLRPGRLWLDKHFLNPQVFRPFSSFATAYTPFAMAPRKPNPASAKGPDPGRVDDDSTAFLGVSLVDDVELAKLVSSGTLVEGHAFAPGKAMVPKPIDNQTVVFAVFFEAGLRLPCNVLLPEILRLFQWDRHWMARWFYHTIPFEAGSDSAKALRCWRRAIAPKRKPKIVVDGAMEAQFVLLRKVCSRLSCRDLVEEFCMLRIFPLSQSWQVTVDQGEEVDVLTLDQAEAEARRMIGDVSVVEYSQLLTRQAARRVNWVYNGELPPRANPHKADDDAGPLRKRMRGQVKLAPRKRWVHASSDSDTDDEGDAEEHDGEEEGEEEEEVEVVAEKAANVAIEDRVDTPGYTPTPSPGHNETGVESNSFPLRRKDLEGAKALVAFSSGKVAKGGPVKKISKTKGLVDIARVFSDDESSDETPTSPAGRSLDLSTAPLLPLGVAGTGGSAAAGASASAERIVTAAARVFGSPLREPAVSPLVKTKGKGAAAEASASEYSLAAPHFAPGDFETRADHISFVEGVSNLVLPAGTPSLLTELNEFDEGCSAIKSLAVRSEPCGPVLTRFKNRLRAKDDEISCKNLEVEALANTLKEVKAKVKRLQSELEKGKEARAEVDRLKAELEKGREAIAEVDRLQTELKEEKAHSAVLTDYYNLTEPKMEALRLKVSKAEASAMEESQRFSREMAKTTESVRTACQTLRLALTDMGAKVREVPAEDASAFDFSEWTQQAGGSVSDYATAYGDCCACVSAAFTSGPLQ
uniref:OSJNBb0016B03.13 protein n=1 Tax=Oryza sativa subsp. japonica TaxID=39947 RepID=Q7XXG8_ORYSJ|nr:OSJNBb0016B03.13 [Oryza sativa Japonica Group]